MKNTPTVSPWWVMKEYAPAWAAYIAWKNMVESIFFPPIVPRRHDPE